MTNQISLDFSTVVANRLQQLLSLGNETLVVVSLSFFFSLAFLLLTNVKDGRCEFDVAVMTRTLLLAFLASLADIISIESTESRIVRSFSSWTGSLLILLKVKGLMSLSLLVA